MLLPIHISINPQDRMAEHKQNIKALKYQNIVYEDTQLCTQKNITSMSLLIYFMCVCLHYLLTVYPPMLPKHNKKLLTLLFSHIIRINPQNYNLLISSTPAILATYPSYYHM
jgi:hypothetical protein